MSKTDAAQLSASRLIMKPAGVVSPKLSRILLEKGAVSPPPAWIKKFEPTVTQDPMTIRKYLGKKSNSKRCVPISTLSWLKDNPSACTDRYQVRTCTENRMKTKAPQAGVNKYRAQKIALRTHARGDSGSVGDRLHRPTDSQPFGGFGPKYYTDLHS
ncbi:hypothetical protein AVEN_13116-1 [Araneus ventricosus]|uniref:Uncharacterized protein n=1 Tax=Araneus ventricosus TaxID=182803 RepID=A0A4Y2R089_ARAVE|nr:hypothetical protein AVEN_13116-1 [Araneus ventricosus]